MFSFGRGKTGSDLVKRLFDLVIATVGLFFLWPAFLAIAVAIWRESGKPIFYRGCRTGLQGVPFKIWKFRTMVPHAEQLGGTSTSESDPRITRTGRFLRRYKLDELPQIFNVLAGEMSLVGPRPEVPEYTSLYDDEEKAILSVRPGITDYASIRFRHLNSLLSTSCDPDAFYREIVRPEKNLLRLQYVNNRSFFEDIRILLKTFALLGSRAGKGQDERTHQDS